LDARFSRSYFYGVFAISLLFRDTCAGYILAAWWGVTLVAVPLAYHASLTDVLQSYATTDYPVKYLKLADQSTYLGVRCGRDRRPDLSFRSSTSKARVVCTALACAAVAFAIWNTFDPFVPGTLGVGLAFAMMIAAISGRQQDNRDPRARGCCVMTEISPIRCTSPMWRHIEVLRSVYGLLGP
jgi:hypothetical protein